MSVPECVVTPKRATGLDPKEICGRFRCRAFALVVEQNAPRSERDHLRKDYAYLFERFLYFMEDIAPDEMGIVVFDESEKSQSHLLLGQMDDYFGRTAKGRFRAGQIVPEPLFVHSDLTTGVQLADLVAYIVSWQVRFRPNMIEPARDELAELGEREPTLTLSGSTRFSAKSRHPEISKASCDFRSALGK